MVESKESTVELRVVREDFSSFSKIELMSVTRWRWLFLGGSFVPFRRLTQ